MSPDYYYTIERSASAEFKDRGSRFIAFAFPISDITDFKSKWQGLKDQHPKAVHHCFAYRIGTDGNTFRSNDDGEPPGSAGKPILGQIDSKQLTGLAVVVVRYFGGTLLGIPGLVNAYKTVTALALQTTPVIQKAIEIKYLLQFDYTKMNEVMTIVKKYNCSMTDQRMELFCQMTIGVPKANHDLILLKFNSIIGLEATKI